MPEIKRSNPMTVKLSDDERDFRIALEEHLGTDGSSIMRQGMLELGRRLGFEFPLKKSREKRKP